MRRGTTPTVTATVDADLSNLEVHLSFDAGTLIIKSGDELDVSVEDGSTIITTTLTQADTLAMESGRNCSVQVRAFNSDGSVAMATSIGQVPVDGIIEDGVLPPEDGGDGE